MDTRKTVFFVCTTLTLGGAERLMLDILACLDRTRYILHLVYAQKDDTCLHLVPADVTCHYLKKRHKLDFFHLFYALSRLYKKEKPLVVISFIEYANYFALLARLIAPVKPAVIITIHNYLSLHHVYKGKRALRKFFIRRLYPGAEQIVAVSRGVRDDLAAHFHCPEHKLKVIYNSVNLESIKRLMHEPVTDTRFLAANSIKKIITCGRLTYQKNQALLLDAFALVVQEIKAHLVLLGTGEEAKALEAQTARLGLTEQVTFCGFISNPYKYLAASDLFVLSSRYEGFGNVLIEAMACGTAVLSTACPAGPDEIITHGKNGWLVPPGNTGALAEAMLYLLRSDTLRHALADQGTGRAQDFNVPEITSQYTRIIDEYSQ